MKKERKYYTAEEKGNILKRHLLEEVPVSKLCAELGLQPTVFLPLAEGVLRERGHSVPDQSSW